MTDIARRLKDEVLNLSKEDRLEIFHALCDSLPVRDTDEDEAEWIEELNRRADDLAAGRAIAEPADKVFAELRDECLREKQPR